jgi:hypothetical protein
MKKAKLFWRKCWLDVIHHENTNYLRPFLSSSLRPFSGERHEVLFDRGVRFRENGPLNTVAPSSLRPLRNGQSNQDDAGKDDDERVAHACQGAMIMACSIATIPNGSLEPSRPHRCASTPTEPPAEFPPAPAAQAPISDAAIRYR